VAQTDQTNFEWLGLCWVDHYFTNDRFNSDCPVSVDLFGRVNLTSKYSQIARG